MTRDESKMYDVRTLERNLRKGVINKKDYEKYLKGLPDRADNAAISKPDEGKEIEYPELPSEEVAAPAAASDELDDE